MKLSTYAPSVGRLRLSALAVAAALVLSAGGLLVTGGSAQAAAVVVPLGTAESFVVLAGAGITNTGPTVLTGDIGSFPNPAISGTGTMTITGTNHAGDNVTQGAKDDLVTAYNVAAGESPPTPITDDLGGKTLTQGVYNSASSIGLTGALTLDAEGDAGAVFVFQAGSTLTTATSSSVVLTNGAQACNVFWQVGSSATIGTATQFRGTILALTSITMNTGATAVGRMLARNGAVTLDTNTLTKPSCSLAPPTTPPTSPPTSPPTTPPTTPPNAPPTSPPTTPPTSPPTSPPTTSPTSPPVPAVSPRPPQVTETPDGSVGTGDASGLTVRLIEPPTIPWFGWIGARTP